ncbi:MAG: TolC family protein [Desulfatiglandales bacterium]
MSPSQNPVLIHVARFFLYGILLFSGCTPTERYTYERIRAAHGGAETLSLQKAQGSPCSEFPDLSGPLGLWDAVAVALKNNPDMDRTLARIHQAEAMIDRALASFWPTFSVYGEYLQGNAPSSYLFKTIDQRRLPPQVDFNDPGWFENVETGIQGQINLFKGGRDLLRKKMAETELKIQQTDRESVENALIASVIQAYFNALAAGEFIRIAKTSVNTIETQLRIMQVRYEGGGALRSDILSLKVHLAQAKEDLLRIENNYNLSLAAMADLLGLDPDSPILLKRYEERLMDLLPEYGDGLVYALAHRPELKKIRQQIVHSRMAVDMACSQYLPRMDARMKVYFDDEHLDFEAERKNWTVGVLLNWDLFTGLSTRAEKNRAQAILNEMMAGDRLLTNTVRLDLKTGYLRLEEAAARLKVAHASVEESRESFHLVKRQYEGGSATITRYLDAELAWNRARFRYAAACYDREKASAALGRALGFWVNHVREVFGDHE